jgi:hypothetical protein
MACICSSKQQLSSEKLEKLDMQMQPLNQYFQRHRLRMVEMPQKMQSTGLFLWQTRM